MSRQTPTDHLIIGTSKLGVLRRTPKPMIVRMIMRTRARNAKSLFGLIMGFLGTGGVGVCP